ncbi:hypothetical protein GRAN_1389 [Granulicella sibirica]|uniref:Uncharacterized protein n=2 Tax=Granulicella sibirica TaxID=2479048 RepID=A0A4Q0T7T5_9BACT|nr:hypothetical protein GRAN_1389 [Granulicella sibirica]
MTATTFALVLLAGCKSKQDQAIDQAKQQAAATGQAQQVVTTDKDGNTTTSVVQPPVPGQATQQVTTTTTSTKSGTVAAAVPPPTVQPVGQAAPAMASADAVAAPNGTAPAPASQPVVSPVNVHIPAGTSLVIRINQHINVKTSHVGERFTGEVDEAVSGTDTGQVLIPRGTHVSGVVDASHRRGHFKGASILELRLTSMTMGGQEYALDTHDVVRTKKGKGKRSAAFIGGGSGLGMLIGGVATGGVGLVVGGLAGGGAGTALAGMTGNRDIDIPAESLMRFKLADDLVVQPNQ